MDLPHMRPDGVRAAAQHALRIPRRAGNGAAFPPATTETEVLPIGPPSKIPTGGGPIRCFGFGMSVANAILGKLEFTTGDPK
jgi:hypothetical protein